MEKWQMACDFIEDVKFQERSVRNSINREKNPFSHTSGRRTMLSRFKEIAEKSEIELFRNTHVIKSGEFVNAIAELKYNDMVDLNRKIEENGKKPLQEAAIVKSILGCRSGYIKGMGHGVQVLHSRESNVFGGVDLKEKLSELESTKAKTINLTDAYTEQSKKMDKMETQLAKMQQLLQLIPSIPPDFFLCT